MSRTDRNPATQAWMERERPDVVAAADTPHAFVHGVGQPDDRCWGTDGMAGCICDACWERKSDPIHRTPKAVPA